MPEITVDGRRLNYIDQPGGDDATPLLFVHAFPLHARMWEPQLEALRGNRRVLAVDLMGFGDSDVPDDPSEYSMDSYADDLAAALDAAGVERAVVVGLSMGGYIAFSLWRRHRARVAALVLADTRAEADSDEVLQRRTAQQDQVRAEGIAPLVEAMPNALLSETTRAKKPDVVERVRALMDNPASGYVGALDAMKRRADSTGDVAGIDVPALVIVGEDDALTPPDAARALDGALPNSRLVVVPEAGHLSSLESPQQFNAALAEFLGEV